MVASLDRLLRPKSIATIGGREATAALRACRRMGFAGEVWPVHPNQTVVDGLRCYPSVDELPTAPDASFVGVNRERTIDVIR
ncbi:MAG: CoA-binding protein, partial [Geminicoccaceae bacterium]